MALQDQLTLLELAKRMNNANLLQIAEVLNQVNEILQDAVWVESNQPTSHVGTQRTHLPTGTWRQVNKGVAKHASATKQVVEPIGRLEDYSIVDKILVEIAPNPQKFRSDEDLAFIEGMSQTFVGTLFYGDQSTDPESFDGFSTRYNALSMANVIGGNGTGNDTTSVWVIEWGPTKCHLIYPKGSSLGINQQDLGIRPAYDSNNLPYEAYWTHFRISGGIFVHDDRCVQRYANIETSGTNNTFNDDILLEALNCLPQAGGGPGTRIYTNRTLKTQMDILAKDKTNVNYTADTAFGVPVTRFRGVPVQLVEQLLNTESAIS